MTHQIGTSSAPGYVDKRRAAKDDFESRILVGETIFPANGGGTTTTIVGANAAYPAATNVVRIGDEGKLFNSSGVLKQETVFRVTGVAVAGSTTVTFTPAAAANTASGDTFRMVQSDNVSSTGNKDRRLAALGFSAARIASLTENDKDYQLRVSDDPGSI